MATVAPVGSDVSSGTYRCTNCGYELGVQSVTSLPPCPSCGGSDGWKPMTGKDSEHDPHPEKN
jgi:lipopolysaccharide biosynthesis regulator YciM